MKRLVVFAVLFTVWLVFAAALSVQEISAGVVLSIAAIILFRKMIAGPRWLGRSDVFESRASERRSLWRRVRAGAAVLVFLPVFTWKVLLSGLNIALLALKPSIDYWPGIIRVHGGLRSIRATTPLANLITLMPGTLTLDYDEKHDDLYVHWIDVTGYGQVNLDTRVTGGLRPCMRRIDL